MNIAEVITTAMISVFQNSGNLEKESKELKFNRYIKYMLIKSRPNRRLHNISKYLWNAIKKILNDVIIHRFSIYESELVRQNKTELYKKISRLLCSKTRILYWI